MPIDVQPRTDPDLGEDATSSRWLGPGLTIGITALSSLAIWIVAPEAIRATFSGPGPLLRVGAVVVGFVVLSVIVGRLVPNPWVARAIVLIPAIAVTWWGLSPYLSDDVVDEDFPVVASEPAPDEPPQTPTDEDASRASTPPPSEATDSTPVEPAAPTPAPAPAGPVALGAGPFQGLTGHRGEGTATVFELPDGSRVLRLEDFDVSNGPGLEVHLVPGADQRGPGDGVKLANLKGNVGNQNYDVPTDLDLSGDWTVLIWCEPFTVEVANATAGFG